ncbi:hypothetical protein GJU93_16165 [Brucella sp. 10RB9212]|uniref:hypothetical protein n=1 Tax=unclassified Brucella TaxID=2632610 RepID=UPI0012ADAD6A|nr:MULTISPECIES: hypothetical protein [unclassified Brucella]MRN48099.1 hypothetical protein [Brucella sp. 10RB9212]
MVKLRGDSLTGDLLAWEPPKVAAGFEPGAIRGNRLASQISQAVALALKSSSMSRAEIAAAMSIELGYQISENMLANYASEGGATTFLTGSSSWLKPVIGEASQRFPARLDIRPLPLARFSPTVTRTAISVVSSWPYAVP